MTTYGGQWRYFNLSNNFFRTIHQQPCCNTQYIAAPAANPVYNRYITSPVDGRSRKKKPRPTVTPDPPLLRILILRLPGNVPDRQSWRQIPMIAIHLCIPLP